MRISDWSSDVCSSDLVALLWLLPRFAAFRGGQVSDQLVQLCTRRAQLAIDEGEALDQNLDMSAGRLGGSRRDGDRRRAQARQQFGRSEEHTSELQSLMRISYAVFCLKNKTQKV